MPDAAKLQALIDKDEIRDVVYRYSRAIDRHDIELLKTCFHSDATADYGKNSGPNDEIEVLYANVKRTGEKLSVMHHHIGNVIIELNGDSATVESYLIDTLAHTTDAQLGVGQNFVHLLIARYLDRFEKRNGEWRIARRVVVKDLRDVRTYTDYDDGYRKGKPDKTDVAYDPKRK